MRNLPQGVGIDYNGQIEVLGFLEDKTHPAKCALVPAQARSKQDTVQPGQPDLNVLDAVLLVQHRVDDQLRAVRLDHSASVLFTEDMHQVGASLKSRDGSKVWGASVHDTAAEDCHPPTFSLVKGVSESRYKRTSSLLQLHLL